MYGLWIMLGIGCLILSIMLFASEDLYGLAVVPFLGALVSIFAIIFLVAEDSSAESCEKLGVVAGVETRYDRWDTCYVKYNDDWYTESTWTEIKKREGSK